MGDIIDRKANEVNFTFCTNIDNCFNHLLVVNALVHPSLRDHHVETDALVSTYPDAPPLSLNVLPFVEGTVSCFDCHFARIYVGDRLDKLLDTQLCA